MKLALALSLMVLIILRLSTIIMFFILWFMLVALFANKLTPDNVQLISSGGMRLSGIFLSFGIMIECLNREVENIKKHLKNRE
jgi:Cu/Ag efflux pump CusA